MSSHRIVSTESAPAAIGPYSQAVVGQGLVWTSGQIGIDPETGELVPGGVEEQTRALLANLSAVLDASGSCMERVLRTTVYLRDMADYAAVNAVYETAFATVLPARAAVAVAGLPKDARVEIDAIASVG